MSTTTLPIANVPAVRLRIRQIVRHHRRALTGVVALFGLAVASGLAGPRLIGQLVQDVEDGTTAARVSAIAFALTVFTLLQALLTRLAFRAAGRLAAVAQAEIREKFVDDLLGLPLEVVERSDDGDLVTRASLDVDNLRRALQSAAPDVVAALVWIVLTLAALLLTSPILALALVVIIPPLVMVNRWYLARARDGFLREAASSSEITDNLSATIQGLTTIEALHLQERRIDQARRDTQKWHDSVRYTLRLRTVLYSVEEFLFTLPIAVSLLLGGVAYQQGWADLAAVTAATLYILQLMVPLEALLDWVGTLQQASASFARLLGVQAVQAVQDGADADAAPSAAVDRGGAPELATRDLRFSYGEGPEVLHGLDLEVYRGERIAVVGPTGSGKSTLARLLAGIYVPDSGRVELAGGPLPSASTEAGRQVVLVTQDQYVFGGSLRDNVALGGPRGDDEASATDEAVWSALETVGARAWAEQLPRALDAEVGLGGYQLTAQQAQQVALARLLVADPRVLILDEATSQMEPGSARELERSLAAVLEGRTVLSIAHRLHTAYDADRIVVLEGGRAVEVGSHDALLQRAGTYARLWENWA